MSKEMGERVRARREKLEMTQAQLAVAVGCSQPMIKKIEGGSKTSLGRKIADALGVSLEWLETGMERGSSQLSNPISKALSVEAIHLIADIELADRNGAAPEAFTALANVLKLMNPDKSRGRTKSEGDGQTIDELEAGEHMAPNRHSRRDNAA